MTGYDDSSKFGPCIFIAVEFFDKEKIELLLKYKVDLKICNEKNDPIVNHLFKKCLLDKELCEKILPILIKKGAMADEFGGCGRQPIHLWALYSESKKAFNCLVKNNVDINARDMLGETALMKSAKRPNFKSAMILIENKAELDKTDAFGKTAAMFAAEDVNFAILEILMEAGCNVLLTDKNKENIMHFLMKALKANKHYLDTETLIDIYKKHPKLFYAKNNKKETPLDFLKKANKKQYKYFINHINKTEKEFIID